MKNYVSPAVEEIKLVAMEQITEGAAGGQTGNGGAGYGHP